MTDNKENVRVLSIFDGMACGMLAMQMAGIKVERYVAYEIEKYAIKTACHNFPMIEQRGDVFTADFTEFEGFDFLIGGSPCTYWSIAQTNNRETEASGMGWELFCQYVRALHEAKPKFFVYENNKSMHKTIRESIDKAFGFEAICINSALVSAQNRQRLYWVGKRNEDGTYSKVPIEQPEDLGILLKDILESGYSCVAEPVNVTAGGKAQCLRATYYKDGIRNMIGNTIDRKTCVAEPICLNSKSGRGGVEGLQPSLQDRIYSVEGKRTAVTTGFMPKIAEPVPGYATPCEWDENGEPIKAISATDGKTYQVYEVKDGQITIKGKRYAIKLADGFYIIRKLTVRECMRLQTVPEWYEFPVSDSRAYAMLGNGWSCRVIEHLLRGCMAALEQPAPEKEPKRVVVKQINRSQKKQRNG